MITPWTLSDTCLTEAEYARGSTVYGKGSASGSGWAEQADKIVPAMKSHANAWAGGLIFLVFPTWTGRMAVTMSKRTRNGKFHDLTSDVPGHYKSTTPSEPSRSESHINSDAATRTKSAVGSDKGPSQKCGISAPPTPLSLFQNQLTFKLYLVYSVEPGRDHPVSLKLRGLGLCPVLTYCLTRHNVKILLETEGNH
jgi:hypothetical protein